MSAFLAIIANPFFLKLALSLLDYFLAANKADAETVAAIKKIAAFLQKNGVDAAVKRAGAEDQIAEGDAAWDEREKPKPPAP